MVNLILDDACIGAHSTCCLLIQVPGRKGTKMALKRLTIIVEGCTVELLH